VLTFFASVLGSIFAHDICATADIACGKIIHRASCRLASFERAPLEQEWLADLQERETVFAKYRHAIGCFLAAPKIRRQAETVTVLLNFQIAGLGTVPFTLKLDRSSNLTRLSFAAGTSRFDWMKRTSAMLMATYFAIKLARSANKLGPGKRQKLADSWKDYKNWGYSARLQRKGLDIELDDEVIRSIMLNPTEALRWFTERLKANRDSNSDSLPSKAGQS
jgi:hypothetical protein